MCIIVNVYVGIVISDLCYVENEVEIVCIGILFLVKNFEVFLVYFDEVFIGYFEC